MTSSYTDINEDVDIVYKNCDLLYTKKSKYQNIKIFKNQLYGKILVIDNDLQLTDFDEANYHEMIVHVPCNYNNLIKNVLIIGGGDGGTARDLLRHKNIQRIDLVDIDIEVLNACKKYFPNLSISLENPKVNIIIEDGAKWVKNNKKEKKNFYDLILIDSTDFNTAIELFTEEFYKRLSKFLNKYGILVFNNMSIPWEKEEFKESKINLSKIFNYVEPYQVFQPSYASGHYSFMFCSNKIDPKNYAINWQIWNEKDIKCKYYNKEVHYSAFNLPNFAQILIEKPLRLGTHFLVDIKNSPFELLDNLDHLFKMCFFIVKFYDLKLISHQHNKFSPQGVSIVFLLAESHLSVHTWPEKGMISLDLFSCKDFEFNKIIKDKRLNIITILKSYLKTDAINFKSIEREI